MERLIDFYNISMKKLSSKDKWVVLQQHNIWIQDLINKNNLENELKNFGESIITRHIDCEYYHYLKVNKPDIYKNSLQHHKKVYQQLVSNDLTGISIPNKFKITGFELDNNNIIPHTGYRIGYYKHRIDSVKIKNKRNIYLEIGGGFGLLAYWQTKDRNSCYIIVDIPNVGILSGYFLMSLGLKVCFYGEYDTFNQELVDNYDIIIIPPNEIEKIPQSLCDFVINTASFTEMTEESIIYYIKEINRIRPKYLYMDGRNKTQNAPILHDALNRLLVGYTRCFKNATPIVYDIPTLGYGNSYFEEHMYKISD